IFDFETAVTGPSKGINGPVATPTLYGLLSKVKSQASRGSPEAYYLFKTKTKTVKVAPAKQSTPSNRFQTGKKKPPAEQPTTKTVTTHSLVAGPDPRRGDILQPYRGQVPKNFELLAVP